jgi:hypothetical protein
VHVRREAARGGAAVSDDYETPRWLLSIVFPNGFFDPCPLRGAFGPKDGLKEPWPTDRPVFINPPYSDTRPWIERALGHRGPVHLLVLVDPSTGWWSDYEDQFQVTLITQKLRFRQWVDPKQRSLSGVPVMKEVEMGGARGAQLALSVAWWYRDGAHLPPGTAVPVTFAEVPEDGDPEPPTRQGTLGAAEAGR